MPRLSEELRTTRRAHVLHSAWRCFGRQGFHATTMDEVIAETGWSASAVYRYFSGKDELIEATARESLDLFGQILSSLLARDPLPTPLETIGAVRDALHGDDEAGRDLPAVIVQNWAESLRNPAVATLARGFWTDARRHVGVLARAWIDQGAVPADADPDGVAAAMVLLVPGLVLDAGVLDGTATSALLAALSARR